MQISSSCQQNLCPRVLLSPCRCNQMNRNTSSFHTILACLCCQIVLKLRADARQCNKKHCIFVWLRGRGLSRKRNIFPSVFAPHKLSREDTGGGNRHCNRLFNYRRVKLDLTPEIEGFHMLFERCHTKNRMRSIIYQAAYKILYFLESSSVGPSDRLLDGLADKRPYRWCRYITVLTVRI